MLSVAFWSWPIYLIYFYGGFFWNNKKSILGYLPQEMQRKRCQSGRMAGQELLSPQLCFTGSVSFLFLPSLWFWLESVAEQKFMRSAINIKFVLAPQSCPTLCNPMGCSPQDSSVHGILQASILEWVAIPFSRGSSQPRDRTQVSCTAGRFFTNWATREVQ